MDKDNQSLRHIQNMNLRDNKDDKLFKTVDENKYTHSICSNALALHYTLLIEYTTYVHPPLILIYQQRNWPNFSMYRRTDKNYCFTSANFHPTLVSEIVNPSNLRQQIASHGWLAYTTSNQRHRLKTGTIFFLNFCLGLSKTKQLQCSLQA